MSTTTAAELTPRQRQVHDLLNQGLSPAVIAKRLKTTPSNVYGHMRNMRAAGVSFPGDESNGNGAGEPVTAPAAPLAPPSVSVDPETSLRSAIEHGEARMNEIDDEVAQLREQIAQLDNERTDVDARTAKYTAALEQLN